eukprot:COSAG01_NODE_6269_length_3761_cov_3.088725_4_plen_85_part_00
MRRACVDPGLAKLVHFVVQTGEAARRCICSAELLALGKEIATRELMRTKSINQSINHCVWVLGMCVFGFWRCKSYNIDRGKGGE